MGQVIKLEGTNFSNNAIGVCRNAKLEFDNNYIKNNTIIIHSDTSESAYDNSNTGLRLYYTNASFINTGAPAIVYGLFFSVYDKWIEIDPNADSLNGIFSYLCSNNPAILIQGARCAVIKDIDGDKTYSSGNVKLFDNSYITILKLIHHQNYLYADQKYTGALAVVKFNTQKMYSDGYRYMALSWQSQPALLGPYTRTVNGEEVELYHDTTKISIDIPELYWVYES